MPRDPIYNIVQKIYTTYSKRFPNASLDNFLTYVRRNFPNQLKWAKQFVNEMKATTNKVVNYPATVKSNVPAVPNTKANVPSVPNTKANVPKVNNVRTNVPKVNNIRVNVPSITQAISRVNPDLANLFGDTISIEQKLAGQGLGNTAKQIAGEGIKQTAKNVLPSLGKIAGGALRGLGVLGAGYTGYQLAKGVADEKLADYMANQYQKQTLKDSDLTTDELVNNYINNVYKPAMQGTPAPAAQTYTGENSDLEPDAEILRLAKADDEYNQTFNDTPPVTPLTTITSSGNINYPITNLPPLNEASTGANQNYGNQVPQAGGISADELSRAGALSQMFKGIQSGYRMPYIGASQDEVDAYTNALQQIGQNISRQSATYDDVLKAIDQDRQRQARIGALTALSNTINSIPNRPYINVDKEGNVSAVDLGGQRINVDLATPYSLATPSAVEQLGTQQKLANQFNDLQTGYLKDLAKLQSDVRTSQATGLPLGVVQNMEAKDYINYLNPIQTGANTIAQEGAKGLVNLLTGQQQADNNLILQSLKEANANERTRYANDMDYAIAQMNNDTKKAIMQQIGVNAQQLERLKQSDPNGYLRAVGSILQAGAMLGDETAQDFYRTVSAQVLKDIFGQDTQPRNGLSTSQANYFTQE